MATTLTSTPVARTAAHQSAQSQNPIPSDTANPSKKVSAVYKERILSLTVENFGQSNGIEQFNTCMKFDMANPKARKAAVLESLKLSTDSKKGSELALAICLKEKLVKYSQAGRIANLLRNIPLVGQMVNDVFNLFIMSKAEKALKKAVINANSLKTLAADHEARAKQIHTSHTLSRNDTPYVPVDFGVHGAPGDMEIEKPVASLSGELDLSELNEDVTEYVNDQKQKAIHSQERAKNKTELRHHQAETNKSLNKEFQGRANANYQNMQLEQEVYDKLRREIEEKNKADKALIKERTHNFAYKADPNAPALPPRKTKIGSSSQPLETPKNKYEHERALALEEAQELFAMFDDEKSTTAKATDTKSSTPFHPVIPKFAPKLQFTPKQNLSSSDNTATVAPSQKKKRKKVAVIADAPQVLKDGKVQSGILLAPWVPENVTTHVSEY